MATRLLLLEDVINLGRSGDIVAVKPGYARNCLLPQQKALVATKGALSRQKRLQEERAKKAVEDRKDAEVLAKKLEGVILTTEVKVDPEGHMYGSVSAADICTLLEEQKQITVDRKQVALPHAIKRTGVHEVTLKLPEGVEAMINLKVESEDGPGHEEVAAAEPVEAPAEEQAAEAE